MKKHLIAAAVVGAFAVPAMAQVTLSGSISVGVVDDGRVGQNAQVGSFGGGVNAINFASTEDLGGGLRAGFTGQMRFNASTGDVNSAGNTSPLLHAANVFIGGGFGTFRVGKIAEASNCAFDPWAGCLTGSGSLMTTPTGNTAGVLTAAQTMSNSVSYTSPRFSGFGLSYQTTLNRAGTDRTVLDLSYSAGPLNAQYLRAEGSVATGLAAGTDREETAISVSYNAGFATLIAAKIDQSVAGVDTRDTMYLAASVPVGPAAIWAAWSKNDIGSANNKAYAVGVNYPLSKRTSVGADFFDKETAGGSTGFALRARHTF